MMRLTSGIVAGLLAVAGMTAQVQANGELHYNQVRLQAEQTESVSNDTMHVTLATFAESRDPADLATAINRDMDWALQIAGSVEGVGVSTGGYQTYPVHKDNVIKSWRGQQNLMLEGSDHEAIGRLVGTLQEKLQVKSMHPWACADERNVGFRKRFEDVSVAANGTAVGPADEEAGGEDVVWGRREPLQPVLGTG